MLTAALHRRLAVSHRAVIFFRAWLGAVTLLELFERCCLTSSVRWLYSDEGAFPRWAVMPPADVAPALHALCLHAWSGSVEWQYALIAVQGVAAVALCAGARPRAAAAVCWALHVSGMLRNPQLAFIFDRYLHVLLLLAALMPTDLLRRPRASAATYALAAQLILIYVDAGYGKLTSPDGAWTVGAEVAALDTYLRHTPAARFARWLLGPRMLRYVGAATAWFEFTIAPLALAAPTQTSRRCLVAAALSLHIGIALTMRNTLALSGAAIAAWLPLVDGPHEASPPHAPGSAEGGPMGGTTEGGSTKGTTDGETDGSRRGAGDKLSAARRGAGDKLSAAAVWLLALASAWHQLRELGAPACAASGSDAAALLQATMLHNRWNVFTGAEPYVVWEVAPARLEDGSIVDVWRGSDSVAWEVPRGPSPALRAGRWRSWPYLAERSAEADDAFWGSLCDEWEARDGRRVVSYVFYLLQADVIPVGTPPLSAQDEGASAAPAPEADAMWAGYAPEFGSVRKRRIRKFSCLERRRALEAASVPAEDKESCAADS